MVDGALRRLQEAAEHIEPVEVDAQLDGMDISGSYLLFEAVNLPYIGPNLHLAPDSNAGGRRARGGAGPRGGAQAPRVRTSTTGRTNRERLAVLPSRRGKHLQIEWTGFPLHIDDKLRPGARAKPKEMAGHVEARLDGETVEFLVPTNEKAKAG